MTAAIFILFFVLLALAVPVADTLGMIAILPNLVDPKFAANGEFIVRGMFSGLDSFTLLAIPMFVLSGIIMANGGISKHLYRVFAYFIGKWTGGLPCAVIITCLFFGAISGSAAATVAAVGSMTIPLLVDLGYDKVFLSALIAVAGGLGVIIPPSIIYVVYGTCTGTSIGDLFSAGIVPGILIALSLMVWTVYYCYRKGEDKERIAQTVDELRDIGLWKLLKESFWALLSPVLILGSIYAGIASPTEAAVISVLYALFVSIFVYKTLTIKTVWSTIREAWDVVAPTLFILASAVAFSRVLTFLHLPQQIGEWLAVTFPQKWVLLLALNIFLLFVGMVMDTSPAILILAPILVPILKEVGVSPVHFGIIITCNLAIGFVTPPVGTNLFVAASLTDINILSIAKKSIPFCIAFFIALLLITYIPGISLLLSGG